MSAETHSYYKLSIIKIITSWLVFTSLSAKFPDQELFLQARDLYQKKNIHQALEVYRQIQNKGPAVWYNMGNCYHYLKNNSQALLSWRRAQKEPYYHLWVLGEKNINSIKQDKVNHLSNLFRTIHLYFTKRIGILLVQIIFLMCWSLLLIMGYRWYTKHYWLLLTVFSLLFALSTILLATSWYQERYRYGIIIPTETLVYAGPNNSYHTIGKCTQLDEVVIEEQKETWYKIHCPHVYGWIPKDVCEAI